VAISHIYKDAWGLAHAKGLPSLIYHEPAIEVKFMRGAAGPTRILTIRHHGKNVGSISSYFGSGSPQIFSARLSAPAPSVHPVVAIQRLCFRKFGRQLDVDVFAAKRKKSSIVRTK
jgi:hypothetical protein